MKIHLHSRLYHLIWKLWPKRKDKIGVYEIVYIVLPRYLFVGGGDAKKLFAKGMCITYKPTMSSMIFLSHDEVMSPKFRYTLWHEYLEGQFLLGLITQKDWYARFEEAITLLGPEICKILEVASKAKSDDKGHYFALIMELALAKKELPTEQFSELVTDALKNRL